ncbi:MAG: hypothetical protein R3B91_10220 [Planctomycetaceae bacterium]
MIAEREAKRQAAIATAKVILMRKAEIAPREAQLDQEQQGQTAKLDQELKSYDDGSSLPFTKWENEYRRSITWVPLDPVSFKSNMNT